MRIPAARQAASLTALITVLSVSAASVADRATSIREPGAAVIRVHQDHAGASTTSSVQTIRLHDASWISHMGTGSTSPQPTQQSVSC
jgi:hypothetical protein